MNSTTDTNQASEELREIFIDRMWNYFGIEDKSELAYFGTIYDQAVAPIIRTEKLKLLAEVRERVIGENERGTITDPDSPSYGEPYESSMADKDDQRAALTKLEAEL